MLKRTSKVDSLKIDSVGNSSVTHIGDSSTINGFSRAMAIQREKELFFSNEGNFDDFRIFTSSLPIPPLDEPICVQSTSINSFIKVGSIDIIGISAAALLHIGNSEHIQMESRILHIRQLEPKEKSSNDSSKED